MCLTDCLCNILVGNKATGDEETFPTGISHLDGLDVGQGHIPHINIQVAVETGLLVFEVTLHIVLGPLVGGVDCVQGVEVVHDRTEDERGAYRGDIKVGLFFLDKIPCSFFRECLFLSAMSSVPTPGIIVGSPCLLCTLPSTPWLLPR